MLMAVLCLTDMQAVLCLAVMTVRCLPDLVAAAVLCLAGVGTSVYADICLQMGLWQDGALVEDEIDLHTVGMIAAQMALWDKGDLVDVEIARTMPCATNHQDALTFTAELFKCA